MPFYNIRRRWSRQRIVEQLVLAAAFATGVSASAQIRRTTDFRDYASDPSWSADGRILFERTNQIVLAGANAGLDRVLVTGRNHSPVWHPNGRIFAYASDDRILFLDPNTRNIVDSFPAAGAGDLRFSRDGRHLAWMEAGAAQVRTGKAVTRVKLPGELTLTGIDDFSFDGLELLLTAHAASARDPRQSEIYSCSLIQTICRAVTHKPTQRQDFARLSPSGRQLLFASSETAWVPDAPIDYEADLWLQPISAPSLAKRMTWFNEPANPRYDAAYARVNAASWSSDGRWLLVTIIEGPRQNHSRIVKIEFPEPE